MESSLSHSIYSIRRKRFCIRKPSDPIHLIVGEHKRYILPCIPLYPSCLYVVDPFYRHIERPIKLKHIHEETEEHIVYEYGAGIIHIPYHYETHVEKLPIYGSDGEPTGEYIEIGRGRGRGREIER